jgi:hypothetical protein
MPSALLVAWLFPPHSSVGSNRPYRLARELIKRGWRVTVLTQSQPPTALRESESTIDLQDIRVIRRYDPPLVAALAAHLDARQRQSRSSIKSSNATSWLDRHLPAEPALLYVPHAWLQLQDCMEHDTPDVLWTTSYPFSAHALGLYAKRKYNLRWIADFRDPWTLHWSHTGKSRLARRIEKAAERSVMTQADTITVTTNSLKNAYQNQYPWAATKIECVRNCFDDRVSVSDSKPDQLPARLIHFGHVYGGARTLAPVLRALAQLKLTREWDERHVVLENFGRFSADDLQLAERLAVRAQVIVHAPVSYADGLAQLRRAALLLLPVWQTEFGPLFLPAKLYDYLSARRRILALGHNPELAEILKQTAAGELLTETAQGEIVSIIEEAVTAPHNSVLAQSAVSLEPYSSSAMGEQFERLFVTVSS